MFPYVVADIGGTNSRFALATGKQSDGLYTLEHISILKGKDHKTFESALGTYLESIQGIKPTAICVAIAGPVIGDEVKMTNLPWRFSCKEVAKKFGVQALVAMNDFAAVAAGIPLMTPEHLVTFKAGNALDGNKAVFGPGTGLGVAGVIRHNNTWLPNSCEGGHVNLAPRTAQEAEIIKAAMDDLGHVSGETLISGPGLVNLYRAICRVEGQKANDYIPADISQKAVSGSDATCIKTLETFCSFLGSFAGNLALTYGATGGIYMAGGVLPHFKDFVIGSSFSEAFTQKGPMSHYVKDIPAYLVTHKELAFNGAAAWLEQQLSE